MSKNETEKKVIKEQLCFVLLGTAFACSAFVLFRGGEYPMALLNCILFVGSLIIAAVSGRIMTKKGKTRMEVLKSVFGFVMAIAWVVVLRICS